MSENKSESEDGKLYSSVNSELDLYRPNLEDYLSSESLPEPHGKLRLYFSLSPFFYNLTLFLLLMGIHRCHCGIELTLFQEGLNWYFSCSYWGGWCHCWCECSNFDWKDSRNKIMWTLWYTLLEFLVNSCLLCLLAIYLFLLFACDLLSRKFDCIATLRLFFSV